MRKCAILFLLLCATFQSFAGSESDGSEFEFIERLYLEPPKLQREPPAAKIVLPENVFEWDGEDPLLRPPTPFKSAINSSQPLSRSAATFVVCDTELDENASETDEGYEEQELEDIDLASDQGLESAESTVSDDDPAWSRRCVKRVRRWVFGTSS